MNIAAPERDHDSYLATCAAEPIHFLGAIQPHAFLIEASVDWIVTRVSANIGEFLPAGVAGVLGRSLAEVLGSGATHSLRGQLQISMGEIVVHQLFGIAVGANSIRLLGPSPGRDDRDRGGAAPGRRQRGEPCAAARQATSLDRFGRPVVQDRGAAGAGDVGVRPGDGVPVPPGWHGRGGGGDQADGSAGLQGAALSGERHPGAGARALRAQHDPVDRRRARDHGAGHPGARSVGRGDRSFARRVAGGLSDPYRVFAEHGRRRVHVDLDPAQRQALGADRVP